MLSHRTLQAESGELPLTVARASGTGAAVVIMPSAFGVGPDLEAQMEEIANVASVVVTFDPFFREDPGPAPYDDFSRVMTRIQGLDRARGRRDLNAVIEWARGADKVAPVVILGICLGGPYALLAAADGVVDGVVTWHGTRMDDYVGNASEMRCPMRLHFGSVDPIVSLDAVERVRSAFVGRDDVQITVHEGATHGYTHRTAVHAYDPRAERASLASLCELIAQIRPDPL